MGLSTIHIPGHPDSPTKDAGCVDSSITLLDDFFLDGVMWGWTGARNSNKHVVLDVERVQSLIGQFYYRTDRAAMEWKVIKSLEHFLNVTVVAHPNLVVTIS